MSQYVETLEDNEIKNLLCELCVQFYHLGWVTGTGGSISIKSKQNKIFMSPSSVQKERMKPHDIYTLDDKGQILKPGFNPTLNLKLSQCHPLFMSAYLHRNAGAVIHTHSINAVMIGYLYGSEFRISHLEMIKGISGLNYTDELVIPIIENTNQECELLESLENAILKYPKSTAVIVRDHGLYIWGKDWMHCKTQCECLDYILEISVKLKSMGINKQANYSSAIDDFSMVKTIVLDIEGTLCPIDFVHKTLFGWIRNNLENYMIENWADPQFKSEIDDIISQLNIRLGFRSIEIVLEKLILLMDQDSKASAFKAFQAKMLKKGFADGLLSEFYADVKPAFQSWARRGLSIGIYSSGAIDLQKLLFSHVKPGLPTGENDNLKACDSLINFLSFFFDASTAGPKRLSSSYNKISTTLCLEPQAILFVTDIFEEAEAADIAGFKTALIVRDGNKLIDTGKCKFPLYKSLFEIQLKK